MIDLLTLALAKKGGGGGETSDYAQLENKPQINGVTLTGDKTPAELGIQETLLAGEGIDIANGVIRSSYGDLIYENNPIYDDVMSISEADPTGCFYVGVSANTDEGNPILTKEDTLKIVAGNTYTDLAFIDPDQGDEYQRTVKALFTSYNINAGYAAFENCHGLYINFDEGYGYFVDENGEKQTERAFVLVIGTAVDDGSPLFVVVDNTNYPLTGNYAIYKKSPIHIPNNAIGFGYVNARDNRPVDGISVYNAVKPEVVSLVDGEITVKDHTEYYITNAENTVITIPWASKIESFIEIHTAPSGNLSITINAGGHIGQEPVFGNGETWAIWVKHGYYKAEKVQLNE